MRRYLKLNTKCTSKSKLISHFKANFGVHFNGELTALALVDADFYLDKISKLNPSPIC